MHISRKRKHHTELTIITAYQVYQDSVSRNSKRQHIYNNGQFYERCTSTPTPLPRKYYQWYGATPRLIITVEGTLAGTSASHPLVAKPADCLSIACGVVAVDCYVIVLPVEASRSRFSGKFLFVRSALPCHEQVSSSSIRIVIRRRGSHCHYHRHCGCGRRGMRQRRRFVAFVPPCETNLLLSAFHSPINTNRV
jgi:hypothetical protein